MRCRQKNAFRVTLRSWGLGSGLGNINQKVHQKAPRPAPLAPLAAWDRPPGALSERRRDAPAASDLPRPRNHRPLRFLSRSIALLLSFRSKISGYSLTCHALTPAGKARLHCVKVTLCVKVDRAVKCSHKKTTFFTA